MKEDKLQGEHESEDKPLKWTEKWGELSKLTSKKG